MNILIRMVLAPVIVLFLLANSLHALKPQREYPATPSEYGIIYKEVAFQTVDSLNIKGWFFSAQDTTGIANTVIGRHVPVPPELKRNPRPYLTLDKKKKPTIIICSGDAGNMTHLIFYAYHLFTRGFNVLTFDWRGFGESDDWPIEQDQLIYAEFLLDYDAAIDFVKNQPEVDSRRIGLLGFSTGAYLSFAMVAKRNDIAAYAGRALLTSFDDLLANLREVKPDRNFRAPKDYPKKLLPINAAPQISIPVFLIVGEKDNRTPPWMSEKIIEELKGPKELWIVPEAEHGGRFAPEFKHYPEFFMRLATFFDKYLNKQQ